MPTKKLSVEMVSGGLRAIITCVDPKQLSADFAGQEYGESFLERIPANVDPCGENGEFHSFAFAGPMFKKSVNIAIGETVARSGFIFTDLLPG
jgi:diphthamide synthase (EF-2-diphthine--ammonia ligase)